MHAVPGALLSLSPCTHTPPQTTYVASLSLPRQAQGIIKRQYGHRVMDEVCSACDGEGCIVTKPPTLEQKTAKVEALIASAESLEDLERYEAALRSGKLDDVLPKQ